MEALAVRWAHGEFTRVRVAAIVDTFGEGLFLPLTILFFLLTTHMGIAGIGVAISVGTALSLPIGLVAASYVGRIGAKNMMAMNNLITAAGYLTYLWVKNPVELGAATFIVMAGDRLYSTAWPELVAQLGTGRPLDALYASFGAWKTASLGGGYVAGALILALGDAATTGRIIIIVNAASCLFAAALILRAPVPAVRVTHARASSIRRTRHAWLGLLRDKRYLILSSANCAISFAWLLPTIIMPVYLVWRLQLPRWLPGAALTISTVLTAVGQVPMTAWLMRFRRSHVLLGVGFVMAMDIALLSMVPRKPEVLGIVLTIVVIIVFTLGDIAFGPTVSAAAAAAADQHDRGLYLGFFYSLESLSTLLGPALLGMLLTTNVRELWYLLIGLAVAGGLSFRALGDTLTPRGSGRV